MAYNPNLTDRELNILILRLEKTLRQIATEYKVTPERIRQIECRAFDKLADKLDRGVTLNPAEKNLYDATMERWDSYTKKKDPI